MNWKQILGLILAIGGLAVLGLKLTHKYDPAPAVQKWSVKAPPAVGNLIKKAGADRVVYIVMVILPVCVGALLLLSAPARRKEEEISEPVPVSKPKPVKASTKPVHVCNVLQLGSERKQVWQFEAKNGDFVLGREQATAPGEPLPAGLAAKDWRGLFQRKLNVAWLPPEQVFLRVAQFPQSEFNETVAMVDLQLEKLSPMPVAQVVWSIQVLPHPEGNMQTVLVIIVGRNVVEEFLGQLEGQGYLADALELPLVDQLQATPITEDGVWIYPEALGRKNSGLAAWWYGGVLQNLDFVNLPAHEPAASLKEQLMQMAWAGELEGWMTNPPRYHLVAESSIANDWMPALRAGLEQNISVVEPLPTPRLAAATARRAAHAPPNANLLPPEFATRYHQQFVDRIWMRGLSAVIILYALGVAVYFVALEVANFRLNGVESEIASHSTEYTNTIQLRARYVVLKDRADLKFAALDCYKLLAEKLPETITLEGVNFADGRRLNLNGSAPADQIQALLGFESAMRNAPDPTKGDDHMFDWERSENLTYSPGPANTVLWHFTLELKRTEVM